MKRFSEFFGDLLAATNNITASSSSRTPATDEARTPATDEADGADDIQKQLANAQREAQKAFGEWRSYENDYYELLWEEAVGKVKCLEARILTKYVLLFW